ncbi:nicotinate-nucleotide adenylyltransferase [Limosilactobacillus sp. Sa3CUN2]|uniref:Probable nicotinate-nucleotide adenylyltransferase n=1 Tax=Limosilactobacillus avistercoris TaxID=2762243 RepID=A0ABR8PEB7_9LACO|nr:nicotinate-nucleotide adenylyltransferase [Limosilactobacillus avistercoris]MBD7895637.1 nicotinate-nucleotide adenylyltransferase [Limosilactobacillus avistercoris]
MQQCGVLTSTETVTEPQAKLIHSQQRQRVGLYGGTFNPIHNAHLLVADQVQSLLCLNRVDFMPDFIPPHVDKKTAIDAHKRVEMLKLAIKGNPHFGIELTELERGGVSYTYDTMKHLLDKNPLTEYYFIIGGDMVDYLPKWHRINDLVKLPRFHFVGVRRQGAQNETNYPVIWVDVPTVAFSSTDIRHRISTGQSIKYMVPEKVEQFIKEHRLYHE